MLVSLSWLSDYVDLKGLSPEAVAAALTDGGLEVENIQKESAFSDDLVVGHILSAARHPNADSLQICSVDVGEAEPLAIVCGAPNARTGLKVAVAKIGAVLPGDFKIKKSKIRGETSCGMLCSEKELGLSPSHDGIIELSDDSTIGMGISQALGLGDTVLELKITPNRADCLGIIGVARDLAARLKRPLKTHAPVVTRSPDLSSSSHLQVTIDSEEGCGRFVALKVDGVRVIPSPAWMQKRLTAAGMRPINLIVDATNYAMLEYSQPVHAYDVRFLRGEALRVGVAKQGETLVTLDGHSRLLEDGDLLICDGEGPVGLAGIMGGQNSEVRDDTQAIVVEVATFSPRQVRRTARRLGLITEASHRFERGTDRAALPTVALRVAELIVRGTQEAGVDASARALPRVAKDLIDVGGARLVEPRLIAVRLAHTRQFLGITGLSRNTVIEILTSLAFRFVDGTDERLVFEIPSFRQDIEREVDVIEEVGRIYGLDKIPYQMPVMSIRPNHEDPFIDFQESVRLVLAEASLRETVTFPFSSGAEYQALGLSETHPLWPKLSLKNPLSESHGLMQTTLIPGLLRAALSNRRRGEKGVRLFECGRGYFASPVTASDAPLWRGLGRPGRHIAHRARGEAGRPRERHWVAGVLDQPWTPKRWDCAETPTSFFHGKGILEGLLKAFGIGPVSYVRPHSEDVPFLHPGAAALVMVSSKAVGFVGELHPRAATNLELGPDAPIVFELDLEALFDAKGLGVSYDHALHRFPPVARDLALLCEKSATFEDFTKAVTSFPKKKYLDRFELFDLYTGDNLPSGKKSMAFTVHFQAAEKTLTDQEVEPELTALVSWLESAIGATRR